MLKEKKMTFAKLDQMPLEMKLAVIAKSSGTLRWTVGTSYANSRTFGPLDPYIEEDYVFAEAGAIDAICEIACLNHSFFLALSQTFSSEKFLDAFLIANGLTNVIARPQFIAHGPGRKSPLIRLAERLGALDVYWTSHDYATQWSHDAVIFEFYRPRPRYK